MALLLRSLRNLSSALKVLSIALVMATLAPFVLTHWVSAHWVLTPEVSAPGGSALGEVTPSETFSALASESEPSTEPVPRSTADVAVVCPVALLEGLEEWIAYRTAQGHRIALVPAEQSTDQIREALLRIYAGGALRHVLLVGDAPVSAALTERAQLPDTAQLSDSAQPASVPAAVGVPVRLVPATVNVRWGSEPEIPSDHWYANLEGDIAPEVAIGRLPVDTPEELRQMVARIIAYEGSANTSAWRRKINFVAGVGGFGALADSLLEQTTRKFLADGIPASYDTTMTFASWRSVYCPDPREFRARTIERHNEGCLFWVYIGHGSRNRLDDLRLPNDRLPILTAADAPQLMSTASSPIALFLACYTCAFDGEQDCLAEEMLRSPGGPIAVMGGTRVTMPYSMAVMAEGLMASYFDDRPETLGEAILSAKQQLVGPPADRSNRQLLDALGATFSPSREQLAAERIEHLHLLHLLGDPLLRLSYPESIGLEMPNRAETGQTLEITGTTPIGGRATIELVCRRGRLTFTPPARTTLADTPEGLAAMSPLYERANDPCYVVQYQDLSPGAFRAEVVVPEHCRGKCHVRVFVEGEAGFALGAGDLYVLPHRPNRSPRSAGE